MENTELNPQAQLVQAIISVMAEVENIDKNLDVGTGNSSYKGVSDKDVKQAVRKAMMKHGLVIMPIGVTHSTQIERWEEEGYNGSKRTKQQTFTEVNTKYLLMHVSGASQVIEGFGQGVDTQDKAAGKATTYALKNALLYLFLVPTGAIDDSDTVHSDQYDTPPSSASKTKTPKTKATTPQPANQPKPLKIVKAGTSEFNTLVEWVKGDVARLNKVKANYAISEGDFEELTKLVLEAKVDALAIPDETILSVKEASSMEELTRIWNDCEGLHTNKSFAEMWAKRKQELQTK